MAIGACPHCGVEVYFSANGICPSCTIHRGAPVTEADHARKKQIADDGAARKVHDAAYSNRSRAAVGVAGVGGAAVVIVIVRLLLKLAMVASHDEAPESERLYAPG